MSTSDVAVFAHCHSLALAALASVAASPAAAGSTASQRARDEAKLLRCFRKDHAAFILSVLDRLPPSPTAPTRTAATATAAASHGGGGLG